MNQLTKCLAGFLNCCHSNDAVISHGWKDFEYVSVEKLGLENIPVKRCTIASSHNSSIGSLQMIGGSTVDNFIKTLNLNFRMLELDLFRDHKKSSHDPVVSHGNLENNLQVTSSISFF